MGYFGRLIFVQGIFLGFCWKPQGFLGFCWKPQRFFGFCWKPQGFFWVLLEAPGIFLDSAGSPRDFLGFDIYLHLIIKNTPPGMGTKGEKRKNYGQLIPVLILVPVHHASCSKGRWLYTRWITTIQWLKLCFRITNYIIHCIDVFAIIDSSDCISNSPFHM